jgi:hypothetical protein
MTESVRCRYPRGVEPLRDLSWIEAHKVSPLEEGNPPLRNQPTDVANGDTEVFRDGLDV